MPLSIFNHPLLFAAVAVVAIGVVIYEFVSSNENRHRTRGRGPKPPKPPSPGPRRPPPKPRRPPSDPPEPRQPPGDPPEPRQPPGDPPRPSPRPDNSGKPPNFPPENAKSLPFKGSETSDESTVVPHSNGPGNNNLRRRVFDRTSVNENSSADSKNAVKDESTTTIKKSCETPSTPNSKNSPNKKFDENYYSQNMLDKLTNDTKNISEKDKCEKFLGHNICEEDSDCSESNLIPKREEKLINRNDETIVRHSKKHLKRKRNSKQIGLKSVQNNDNEHNSDQHQTDSNSDDSVIFDSMKFTKSNRKQKIHAYKQHVTNQRSQSSNLYPEVDSHASSSSRSDSDNSSSFSDSNDDIYKEQLHEAFKAGVYDNKENLDGSVIDSPERIQEENPANSTICRGCEEKPVNTHAYPCNHSYLCADCAVRIFLVCKKCAVCLADVEEFLQIAS